MVVGELLYLNEEGAAQSAINFGFARGNTSLLLFLQMLLSTWVVLTFTAGGDLRSALSRLLL